MATAAFAPRPNIVPLPAAMAVMALLALVAAGAALASPTSSEFQQCHRVAAATLQYCLDETPGNLHGPGCWQKSRRSQERCYDEVRASHQRPPPRPGTTAPTEPTTPPRQP